MNGKTSLGAGAVTLTVSKIITMVISMVISMLLSRFRTLEEYGTYSQMLLAINLVSSFLMLGLPNSINYFLSRAETDSERQKFLSVYYALNTVLGLIIGTVLVLSVPLIEAYFKNPLIHNFIYFLALIPWSNVTSNSLENLLVVYNKTHFVILFRMVTLAAQLGVVVAVQLLGFGFKAYLISAVTLNCIIAVLVYIIAARQCGGFRLSFNGTYIRTIFAFSIPIGIAGMVGTLNIELDKMLIGYLMDTEEMAIYTNAAKELPLSIVPASITAVLLPKLTRMIKDGQNREAVRLWGTASELALIVMAFVVAGVFTYAEDAMTFLYSAKYISGVNVFRVYTLNLLLRITYFGMILNALGKTRKILVCSIASLVLNLALNPLMYMLWGMIGPAIATFVSILIVLLFQLKITASCAEVRFSEIFPWKQLFMILIVNILFSVVFLAAKHLLPFEKAIGEIGESISLGVIWGFLYFFFMRGKLAKSWRNLNERSDNK